MLYSGVQHFHSSSAQGSQPEGQLQHFHSPFACSRHFLSLSLQIGQHRSPFEPHSVLRFPQARRFSEHKRFHDIYLEILEIPRNSQIFFRFSSVQNQNIVCHFLAEREGNASQCDEVVYYVLILDPGSGDSRGSCDSMTFGYRKQLENFSIVREFKYIK